VTPTGGGTENTGWHTFHCGANTGDSTHSIIGGEGGHAMLNLLADQSDNDDDRYRITSRANTGNFTIDSESTGSWVSGVIYDGSASNVTISTPTNAETTATAIIKTTADANPAYTNLQFHSGAGALSQIQGRQQSTEASGGLAFYTRADDAGSLTERMVIRDSGLIGMGESSPDVQLHLKKNTAGTVNELLRLENAGGSEGVGMEMSFNEAGTSYGKVTTKYESGWKMQLGGGNDLDTLTLFNGNVGILTTSPQTPLEVQGHFRIDPDSGSAMIDMYTGGTRRHEIIADTSGNLEIRPQGSGTNRTKWDSSGNVTIASGGDTNIYISDAVIDMYSPVAMNNNRLGIGKGSASAPSISFQTDANDSADYDTGMYSKDSNVIGFATNGTERLAISDSVNIESDASGWASIITSTNASPYVTKWVTNAHPNNETNMFLQCDGDGDDNKFKIWSNGELWQETGGATINSDRKLKDNIVDASSKLDDINKLKVRNFNYKKTPDIKRIGFIAQEVEEIFPSLVKEHPHTTEIKDDEGNVVKPSEWSKNIQQVAFIPMLIKSVQELSSKLDTANDKITALENA